MVAPAAVCEVAFATDPGATPTWTDVSNWLQGFTIERGRQEELNRMEAGTARILLDNLDRRFDPSNAASPYAPNVVPMRRVRLSAGAQLLTNPSFETDVSGWTSIGAGTTNARLASDGAVGSASLQLVADGASSFLGRSQAVASVANGDVVTVSAYIKRVAGATGTLNIDTTGGGGFDAVGYSVPLANLPTAWTRVSATFTYAGTSGTAVFRVFVDGTPAAGAEVRIDGLQMEKGSNLTGYTDQVYRLFSGYAETWPPTYPTELDSDVEVQAVDAFKVFNLKNLNTSYIQQLTSARVAAVLTDIGWPAGDRSIATGDSNIQAVTLVNESALQHLQDTIDVENGLLFMTGDGVAKFVNRGALILAPYTTSQGTFGDGGGTEMLFRDIEFDYSDVQLWNEVRFTRDGGTEQVASDSSSQTRYYPRTLSRSALLMINDADALAAAQWVRDRFKAPALRVQRLVLDGEASPTTLYSQMFGREIGDRVTVRKTPPGGGARIEQIGRIEHVEHTWSVPEGWTTSWQLSPADLQLYWILEHATQGLLDSTTVLSY